MPLTLNPLVWNELADINWSVNKDISYRTDLEAYGTVDFWTSVADGKGDCDDYALTKRRLLREKYPQNNCDFRLCLCATEVCPAGTPYDHAVLVVVTDRGDYVLDNRFDTVFAWKDMPGYRFVLREDGNDGWETLT